MISVFFEFLTRGLIWILKSIFDMIAFVLRQLFRLLRLFMVLLPVTGIIYGVFFFMITVECITGESIFSSLIPIELDSATIRTLILETISGYLHLLSGYSGTMMYFLLILFLLILILPLTLFFITIGTFVFSAKYLLICSLVDLFSYLVGSVITGRSPGEMLKRRYRRLFPKIGRKLDERSYNKWLSRNNEAFENDTYGRNRKKSPLDEFYEESYEDYDESEEFYGEEITDDYQSEYDDNYLEEYEDNYSDEFEDEDFYETDDEYEDLRIEDKRNNHQRHNASTKKADNPISSFNFFAGCNSLESATRKYKSLVKLYHPDNMDGDTSALQEINVQYNAIKKRLS